MDAEVVVSSFRLSEGDKIGILKKILSTKLKNFPIFRKLILNSANC